MRCRKWLFDRWDAAVEHVAGKVRKNRLESYKPSVKINLTDPDLYSQGDPYAAWRWLREHKAGTLASPRGSSGFWVLDKDDDVRAVYRDAALLDTEIRDIAHEVVYTCSRTLIDGRR